MAALHPTSRYRIWENTVSRRFATWNRADRGRSAFQHCLPAVLRLEPPVLRLRAQIAERPPGRLQAERREFAPALATLGDRVGQEFTRGASRRGAMAPEGLHPPQPIATRAELRHLVARVAHQARPC